MIIKANIESKIETIEQQSITQVVNGFNTLSIVGGEFAVIPDSENVAIKTLLGSCVAIMFYDEVKKITAMNHFLLPDSNSGNSLKFGLYSVELMLNEMYKIGCTKNNIVAKIAGGGHILSAHDNRIGDKNVDFALNFCSVEHIPVVGEQVRGEHGRVVLLAPQFQTFIRVVKNRAVEAEIKANESGLAIHSSTTASTNNSDNITLF